MKNKILFVSMLLCSFVYSQTTSQYDYKREVLGVSEQWHKLVLPNDLFAKVSPNFNDLKILGINTHNDTLEVPYLLEQTVSKNIKTDVPFKIINTVRDEQGHYFTLALENFVEINQINLEFKQANFDWLLTLEASQDQHKWATVIEDYRILSIQNEHTNYKFTKVTFPTTKYPFYRFRINSKEGSDLTSATIFLTEQIEGEYQEYNFKSINIINNKDRRQTEIEIDLNTSVPVSQFNFDIQDDFDFYRPFTIQYLVDSFKTKKGWRYNYQNLSSGILSSVEQNSFSIQSRIAQKIKIIIHNHNNQPLNIKAVTIKGPKYEMIARFTETEATYFLYYGNHFAHKPKYDISYFANNIPTELVELELGAAQKIQKNDTADLVKPLFKNKIWLWVIMAVISVTLGWFSLKMIKGI